MGIAPSLGASDCTPSGSESIPSAIDPPASAVSRPASAMARTASGVRADEGHPSEDAQRDRVGALLRALERGRGVVEVRGRGAGHALGEVVSALLDGVATVVQVRADPEGGDPAEDEQHDEQSEEDPDGPPRCGGHPAGKAAHGASGPSRSSRRVIGRRPRQEVLFFRVETFRGVSTRTLPLDFPPL